MASTIERFQQFEKEQGLLDFTVNGYRPWVYVRFTAYMKMEAILNSQEKRQVSGKVNWRQELGRIILNCTIRNPLLTAPKKDVLIFTHARRTQVGGKYECLYTDALKCQLGSSAVSAEFLIDGTHRRPSATDGLLLLDCIDLFPVLHARKLRKKYSGELVRIRQFIEEAVEKLTTEFGADIGRDFLSAAAQKRFIWYVSKKCLLKKLIHKVSPKVIVEVVGYETNKMIINEVAAEMEIPTVELQHGVIGRGHIAYNYAEKHDYTYLPKYVFLFSEYWKQTASFAQSDERLVCTGYPYLEKTMKQWPKEIRSAEDIRSELRILVLSQPEYSIKLQKEIEKLIKLLDASGKNYTLIYKLHPAEYRQGTEQFAMFAEHPHVELIRTADINLYSLFAKADVQVGVTSTAVFEGLAYGLETFILHYEKTDDYMGDLVARGCARMCSGAEELAAVFSEISAEEIAAGRKETESSFFLPGSLERMQSILEKIKEKTIE